MVYQNAGEYIKQKGVFEKAMKYNNTAWLRYSSIAKQYNTLLKESKHKFDTFYPPSFLSTNPRKFWELSYPKE